MPRSEKTKSMFRTISFEIGKDRLEELDKLSKALGCYRSDIIRVAINNYLPRLKEENSKLLKDMGK